MLNAISGQNSYWSEEKIGYMLSVGMSTSLMRTDLVMWTQNGTRTLPLVLRRIEEVIPCEFVGKRIIVDDRSTDSTKVIAESFGWQVVQNEGKGISAGANTALKHVTSDCFISFEQDLLLDSAWWKKIPEKLSEPRVAVASGMRFADKPIGLRRMQQYVARKYVGEAELASWLRTRQMSAFTLGKTLDNTIYKTEIIRKLGGFPKTQANAGVETVLAYAVAKAGYQWAVDYCTQSIHLRSGLRQELAHQEWYASLLYEIWNQIVHQTDRQPPVTKSDVIYRFLLSPFTGVFMAAKLKEPSIAYIHPLIRLYYLRGLLKASK